MIVLNLLNRLFGSGDRLTRRDIDRYQSVPHDRQRIEEQVANDSFEDHALDGWRESGLDTSAMSDLDQKIVARFAPKKPFLGSISLVLLLAGITASILLYRYYTQDNVSIELVSSDETSTLFEERSDLELSPVIISYVEIDTNEQVQPNALIAQFAEQKKLDSKIALNEQHPTTDEKNKSNTDDKPNLQLNSEQIALKSISTSAESSNRLAFKTAAEVYLHDLKLIDYREYRSGSIKTERLQYSGTPANQAEPGTFGSEDLVWIEVQVPYHEYLEKTISLFSKRKYKQALQRFETILNTYPDDHNASFYAALCLFNLGQYNKTIEHLHAAYSTDYGNFYEEALWYKAKTYDKMKEYEKSGEIYLRIIDENGFYAKEAQTILGERK